ncbi:MAG TPA: PhoH family protein [Candidatus Faeciplasma gallinarum]|uniref:PhoH-like protein n=1 Tax=Candidatus Faeciplasma gallinarum TaxID=2840799 RepID=A0A9D1EPQ0_9FIRM|nr:PhoH family protein [Candidatus Faeciplasma gallinarum]
MTEKSIVVTNINHVLNLFGSHDENIRLIQDDLNVNVITRGSDIKIAGNQADVDKAYSCISALLKIAENGDDITEQQVRYILSMADETGAEDIANLSDGGICVTSAGKIIKPKTLGQKKYIESIKENTISFGVGPAGTGKTFLAVSMAVRAFRSHEINKIILTRPAVEAGEKLGFLPGDLQTKVDPYLRPLYDALFEMLGAESFAKYQERGSIEVAPLAYMRGRTLDDAFVILDEAQNTSPEQMKMFLTRLGFNSKMVITGDVTQIDLPDPRKSGLIEAVKVLKNVNDIGINYFSEKDVVRHKLVQDIVKAYERYNNERMRR